MFAVVGNGSGDDVNQTNPPMDIFVSTVQNSCSVDKLSSEEYQLKQQLGNLVGTFI